MTTLTRCSCGSAHDASARCADVAECALKSQAIIAADDAFMEIAAPLLDALEAMIFHNDALSGVRFDGGFVVDCEVQSVRWRLSETHRMLTDALEELRGKIAHDHGLWDGIDAADIPLVTVERAAKERRERVIL